MGAWCCKMSMELQEALCCCKAGSENPHFSACGPFLNAGVGLSNLVHGISWETEEMAEEHYELTW